MSTENRFRDEFLSKTISNIEFLILEEEMKSLRLLEEELDRKQSELQILHTKINKLKRDKSTPILRKKYVGKYFKYKNNSGNNEWYVYSFCEKIIDDVASIIQVKVHTFESAPNGRYEFNIGQSYTHLFETEITKSQYFKALDKFEKSLAVLRN